MPTSIAGKPVSESTADTKASCRNGSLAANDALDKFIVAGLAPTQISRMTCDELVRVVLAAQLPLLQPEIKARLECYDRQKLERLVYLARRCCRNQGY